MSSLAPLAVAIPLLVAAVLVGASPVIGRRAADLTAIITAAGVTGLCAVMAGGSATSGLVVYWFGGFEPSHGVALGIAFAVDPLGAGLATLIGVLMLAALIFSWAHVETAGGPFNALMLVFLGAMVGFCLSGDLFNMFVFFELLGVAAIALTGYKADERAPLQGSLNFAITAGVGAF
ncbi:MAG: hypothetical protein ACR2NJ_09790 [Acidimicrobiales bacterium]